MENFEHFILTRYNTQFFDGGFLYDNEGADEWMEERQPLFAATRDSVLSQEGNFKWIISVDKRTPEKFLKKIFTDKRMIQVNCDIREAFKEVKTKGKWVITTRLDNDDRYLPGAIKAIQEEFEPKLKVIDIDYEQLFLKTGKRYTSERKGPNSPFLSLIEPSDRIMTAFCRPHSVLHTGYPIGNEKVTIDGHKIRKVYAYMIIHGKNAFNSIVGREV